MADVSAGRVGVRLPNHRVLNRVIRSFPAPRLQDQQGPHTVGGRLGHYIRCLDWFVLEPSFAPEADLVAVCRGGRE